MLDAIKNLFKKNYVSLNGNSFKEKFKSIPKAVLIDVRTPGEFSRGAIRGARNINYMSPDFISRVKDLDKTKTYFLYCQSGGRSGRACASMGKLGFSVYNLSGGIYAWPN